MIVFTSKPPTADNITNTTFKFDKNVIKSLHTVWGLRTLNRTKSKHYLMSGLRILVIDISGQKYGRLFSSKSNWFYYDNDSTDWCLKNDLDLYDLTDEEFLRMRMEID